MSDGPRMTLKENLVFRALGLLLVLAPKTGADILAATVVKVNVRVAKAERERRDKAVAA